MQGATTFFQVLLGFTTLLGLISSQNPTTTTTPLPPTTTPSCGENSTWIPCGTICQPVCNEPFTPLPNPTTCTPGEGVCGCKPGFIRHLSNEQCCVQHGECWIGPCISDAECLLSTTSTTTPTTTPSVETTTTTTTQKQQQQPQCKGQNEVWEPCATNCQQVCNKPITPCPKSPCHEGDGACVCQPGFMRASPNGSCIRCFRCPGANEIFSETGSCCQPFCGQTEECIRQCFVDFGCICKPGFIRTDDGNGQCIPEDKCPNPKPIPNCNVNKCPGPNEVPTDCYNKCSEDACDKPPNPICTLECRPDVPCKCAPRFKRLHFGNINSPCLAKCPGGCEENETQ